MNQQGDVALFNTVDGGDISVEEGLVEMGSGLATTVYLSLFGANHDDPGQGEHPRNWWGNLVENDTARQYRSESQYLIDGLPAIPANLRRIEDATERDLQWMLDTGAAHSINVTASMPGPKRIRRQIDIEATIGDESLVYEQNWRAET